MDHADGVRRRQRQRHTLGDLQHLLQRQQVAGPGVAAQVVPGHEFHHQVGVVLVATAVQHLDDVGVVQSLAEIGLAHESRRQQALVIVAQQKGLDRHGAAVGRLRFEDLTQATPAQGSQQSILRQLLCRGSRPRPRVVGRRQVR